VLRMMFKVEVAEFGENDLIRWGWKEGMRNGL
jgi:hypothetical protein